MTKEKIKPLLLLHSIVFLYSLGGVASKYAAKQPFLSVGFILCYGIVLADLFVYAVLWQQILKQLPLVVAYANKAATVVWGIVLGYLVFGERITVMKVIGSAVIVAGVYLVVSDKEDK